MKKILVVLFGMLLSAFPLMASASTFTLNPSQLGSLYEVWEDPGSAGTYLNPVQPLSFGAKYTGNIRTGEFGLGGIQIGANYWGQPYGGAILTQPTNNALSMGSLLGFDKYGLNFENANENPWQYNVYFNVGWTTSGETDYYVEGAWKTIANGSTDSVILDLTKAYVWGGSYSGALIDVTTLAGVNLGHISNMGFKIEAEVPLPTLGHPNSDYTFETLVTPVPEPVTLLLLGLGLVGLAGIRRKFKISKS